MPSRGRKFIAEFLIPSLNEKRFGSRLMWLDIENEVFQMQWNHKSAADWTTSDAAVFAAWDKRKGHYKPDDKDYYTKSKQRFRAALNKFIKDKHITELYSEDKYTKLYCIGNGRNISETFCPSSGTVKNEKENDGNENLSQKVKQDPEDLALDLNDIWNADLSIDPQRNSLSPFNNNEVKKEYFINAEQVVTDDTSDFISDLFSDNSQNYIQSLNFSSGNKKNLSAREISNVRIESDVKLLHFIPETNIFKKDNLQKRVVTIVNDDFYNYLCSVKDTSRQMEWFDNNVYDVTAVSDEVAHMQNTG